MNRAVFLDRDGVINAMVYNEAQKVFDSPYDPKEFELLPTTAQAIKLINTSGMLAIVISNQPGVAKGKCSIDTMNAITQKMQSDLATLGSRLDRIYYCFHHPEATVQELRRVCSCRKPEPGMLLKAAQECSIDLKSSFMIGDTAKDIKAGLKAGCRTVLLCPDTYDKRRVEEESKPHMVASSLLEAIQKIQGLER